MSDVGQQRDRRGVATLAQAHATRRQRQRQRARRRVEGWVVQPIGDPRALPDPLQRRRGGPSGVLETMRLLLAALLLHGLMLAVFFTANTLLGGSAGYRPPETVAVRIVEPVTEAEAETETETETVDEAETETEAEAETETVNETETETVNETETETVDEPPRPRPRRSPPADPIEAPAEPAPAEPRRRIVGLSMESTVVGAGGPGFAVGTTRMGKTEQRAVAPKEASQARGLPESSAPQPPAATPSPTTNRVATRLPVGNVPVIKPTRVSAPEPEYPPLLKQQGIEGDVVLMVTIDEQGHVTRVQVVRKAPQQAFNDAAVAAAKLTRYTPATRSGVPMTFTQRYTVRFRIQD